MNISTVYRAVLKKMAADSPKQQKSQPEPKRQSSTPPKSAAAEKPVTVTEQQATFSPKGVSDMKRLLRIIDNATSNDSLNKRIRYADGTEIPASGNLYEGANPLEVAIANSARRQFTGKQVKALGGETVPEDPEERAYALYSNPGELQRISDDVDRNLG